jgi:hypothetical protein
MYLFCIQLASGSEAFHAGDYSDAEADRLTAVIRDRFATPEPYKVDLANCGRPQVDIDGALAEWDITERRLEFLEGHQDQLVEALSADPRMRALGLYGNEDLLYPRWYWARSVAKQIISSRVQTNGSDVERPLARPVAEWKNPVPSVPPTIHNLEEPTLRRCAETAWRAGHTSLNAINAWEEWWHLAKLRYLAKESFDPETGDAISRDGAAAIRVLCGLGARRDAFSDDGNHLLQFWPTAPSDLVDPTWYVDFETEAAPFDVVRKTNKEQLFHSQHILKPAVHAFLADLEVSPNVALMPLATPDKDQTPSQDGPVIPDGFSWKGKTYHGLPEKPFRAVEHLWNCRDRVAPYQELAEPVYGDREADLIPDNAIGGFRREINKFFRRNDIPFHAKQVNGCLALREGLPQHTKSAANGPKPAPRIRRRK